jgi:hypothetical protein
MEYQLEVSVEREDPDARVFFPGKWTKRVYNL